MIRTDKGTRGQGGKGDRGDGEDGEDGGGGYAAATREGEIFITAN